MKFAVGLVVLAAFLAPQQVGSDVPDLSFKSVDGKECQLHALCKSGKVVAIVSWSVDCPSGKPCIPRATEVAKKYAGNDKVVFLAVSSYGDTAEKLAAYVKENSISYPVVVDADKKIGRALNAKQVNSAYVVKGCKLFWYGGITKDGKDKLVDAIEAALGDKGAPESGGKFVG
jgi:peroxiredoxin